MPLRAHFGNLRECTAKAHSVKMGQRDDASAGALERARTRAPAHSYKPHRPDLIPPAVAENRALTVVRSFALDSAAVPL